MLTYLDLFAGSGGLSEGFLRNGFRPVAHIEADDYACQTLRTRTCYYHLRKKGLLSRYVSYLNGKLRREELYALLPSELQNLVLNVKISRWTVDDMISSIRQNMKVLGVSRIDLLAGGPPCQPFSIVGRGALNTHRPRETRANLYRFFAKVLHEFKPRVFVFENVPGLLSAKNGNTFARIARSIRDAGYEFNHQVLDARTFGVLQQRKRVVLIGWRKALKLTYPVFAPPDLKYKVSELLADLPDLEPGTDGSRHGYSRRPSRYLVDRRLRTDSDILTQHSTRPHNDRDREIYEIAIELWNSEQRRLKYPDLPKRLRTRKNQDAFLDRFKVVASNLPYAHTLIAHIARDGHYYIHPSRNQLRSLSVREAARIQSFPDNYFFEGGRTAAFRQIGNAVPPLMAQAIAAKIKRMLE